MMHVAVLTIFSLVYACKSLRLNSYDNQFPSTDWASLQQQERPKLLLFPRELWASGFDARFPPSLIATNNMEPSLWTSHTVDEFRTLYNQVMNPDTCDGRPYTVAKKPIWGLTSRIRDFGDMLIEESLLKGGLVLIEQDSARCPAEEEPESDSFMNCIFKPFSICQGKVQTTEEKEKATRATQIYSNSEFLEASRPIWSRLSQNGLITNSKDLKRGPDFTPLGVIRSMLIGTAFKFTDQIEKYTVELEKKLKKPDGPMLVIHIRRTDKITDFTDSNMTVPDGMRHMAVVGSEHRFQSLRAIQELEKRVESQAGTPYNSIFMMSDDPEFYETRYLDALQKQLVNEPVVLINPYVQDMFGNLSDGDKRRWQEAGHTALSSKGRDALNMQLAADMNYAIKHGSHIIGCGRSGVSQFIAQGLGARYMVDPNALSAFEDDATLLNYVMGSVKATRHLQFMSTYMQNGGLMDMYGKIADWHKDLTKKLGNEVIDPIHHDP